MKTRILCLIFSLLDDPSTYAQKKQKLREAAKRISLGFSTYQEALDFNDSIQCLLK